MSELIFVGYTNGSQIKYAEECEGAFYPNTYNECYIPLYMLKTHQHRIESTSNGDYRLVRSGQITQLEKDKAELSNYLAGLITPLEVKKGLTKHEAQCMADSIRNWLERMK